MGSAQQGDAAYNERRFARGEFGIDTAGLVHKSRTLEELNAFGHRYLIELISPGQERDQMKSGCMTLGNDDERNCLPFSIQIRFDVFTSTNYNLMCDLVVETFTP